MTATIAATKARPAASPLAEAQLDREAASADVERLTAKIEELKRGATADPTLLAQLETEREAALKTLRGADLEAAEQITAVAAPISAKTIDKIRRMRRKVSMLHAGVMTGMGESQRLRAHLGGLRSEITALKESWEFKRDDREFRSPYARTPGDPQLADDHPAPARGGKKTPQSVIHLASLERAVEAASAEMKIAEAAQVAATERWQSEKSTLDSWEEAIRAMGPVARAMLNALPTAISGPFGAPTGVDFRNAMVGAPVPASSLNGE